MSDAWRGMGLRDLTGFGGGWLEFVTFPSSSLSLLV